MNEQYKKWLIQFRKGFLEICVLKTLHKHQKLHGAGLIDLFEQSDLLVNEGTMYPLLNRMETNGWINSSWEVPEGSGHPKRVYSLNNEGEKVLPLMIENYKKNHQSFNNLN